MNQKIFEIAKRVDDELIAAGGVQGSPEFNISFVQKFAETIINECVAICDRGAATQTTSQGAAILIRERFEI